MNGGLGRDAPAWIKQRWKSRAKWSTLTRPGREGGTGMSSATASPTAPSAAGVVGTFVEAWGYMTGQSPGHLHARDGALAVTLSQTNCAFLNVIAIDQPVADADALRTVLADARRHRAACPHDAMLMTCPEWLPEGASAIIAAQGLSFFMRMWGMWADRLLPPRRPAPTLDFRLVTDAAGGAAL